MNLEEPSEAIRRVIWIFKGLNKHEKVGREKINLLSKIDRFEEERRKKSIVIFLDWKIPEMKQW